MLRAFVMRMGVVGGVSVAAGVIGVTGAGAMGGSGFPEARNSDGGSGPDGGTIEGYPGAAVGGTAGAGAAAGGTAGPGAAAGGTAGPGTAAGGDRAGGAAALAGITVDDDDRVAPGGCMGERFSQLLIHCVVNLLATWIRKPCFFSGSSHSFWERWLGSLCARFDGCCVVLSSGRGKKHGGKVWKITNASIK